MNTEFCDPSCAASVDVPHFIAPTIMESGKQSDRVDIVTYPIVWTGGVRKLYTNGFAFNAEGCRLPQEAPGIRNTAAKQEKSIGHKAAKHPKGLPEISGA